MISASYPALVLSVASFICTTAPSDAQRTQSSGAAHLPTYVTQIGYTAPGGDTSLRDSANAVVALPSGAVIVAGETFGSLGEPHAGTSSSSDAFIARFDPLGNLEWIRQIGAITGPTIPGLNGNALGVGGDASDSEFVGDVAVGRDGSIYVAGSTWGSPGETNAGLSDLFLAKFDRDGGLQWLRQLGVETALSPTPSGTTLDPSSVESATSLLLHPSGAVYVAGATGGSLVENSPEGLRDAYLARFSANGRLDWVRQIVALGDDEAADIALRPPDQIVLASSTDDFLGLDWTFFATVYVFDPDGSLVASRRMPSGFHATAKSLAVDPRSDRIFLAGNSGQSLSFAGFGWSEAYVASFDVGPPGLAFAWARQIGAGLPSSIGFSAPGDQKLESVGGLHLGADGNPVLVGATEAALSEPNAGKTDIFVASVQADDGAIQWTTQFGAITGPHNGAIAKFADWANALDVDRSGMIVVCGSSFGNFGGDGYGGSSDVLVMRLNPDGSL